MAGLLLHGRPVPTISISLGRDENDMTFALDWGIAAERHLPSRRGSGVTRTAIDPSEAVIDLRRHDELGGFTDVELTVPGELHLIFGAKRGWNLLHDGLQPGAMGNVSARPMLWRRRDPPTAAPRAAGGGRRR